MGIASIDALGYTGMGSYAGAAGFGQALAGLTDSAKSYSELTANAVDPLSTSPLQNWDVAQTSPVTISAAGQAAGAGLSDGTGANMSDLAQALILALVLSMLETTPNQ